MTQFGRDEAIALAQKHIPDFWYAATRGFQDERIITAILHAHALGAVPREPSEPMLEAGTKVFLRIQQETIPQWTPRIAERFWIAMYDAAQGATPAALQDQSAAMQAKLTNGPSQEGTAGPAADPTPATPLAETELSSEISALINDRPHDRLMSSHQCAWVERACAIVRRLEYEHEQLSAQLATVTAMHQPCCQQWDTCTYRCAALIETLREQLATAQAEGREQAAKVCDAEAERAKMRNFTHSWRSSAETCAAAIRALK